MTKIPVIRIFRENFNVSNFEKKKKNKNREKRKINPGKNVLLKLSEITSLWEKKISKETFSVEYKCWIYDSIYFS